MSERRAGQLVTTGRVVESGRWRQTPMKAIASSHRTQHLKQSSKARCCKLDPASDTEALPSPCS